MYKCLDCGHIFDDGEQKVYRDDHGIPGDLYEEIEVCPVCGGGFETTKQCKKCGAEFLAEELYGEYYCDECLKEMIDYDTFLDFALEGAKYADQIDVLEDFIFCEIFDVDCPQHSSSELKRYCKELYLRLVGNDKLLNRQELYEKILDYFFRANLYNDFADFLWEKRYKNA